MAIKRRLFSWNARLYGRTMFVLVFAGIGAYVLGSESPALLTWIYLWLAKDKLPSPIELGTFKNMVGSWVSILPLALIGTLVGGFVGNLALTGMERLVEKWDRMHIGDRVTLFLGVFAGIIASVPVLLIFQNIPDLDKRWEFLGICAVTVGFIVMAIYTLMSMSEYLPWNRGRPSARRSGIKLLDTNVIIDGRIYDVVRSGFLDGQIYVPGFVLDELQHIADSHDSLRRQRGRRGLDVLRHMQTDFNLEVRVHDRFAPDQGDEVDARLVRLAKAMGADIVTNDFNLNRVASVQEVKVLSLNDLALALRSNVMPQETLTINVNREGNQPGQGVGYLEDGTMVVVENGKPHIGETMEVVVTQVIQTERGKMIFAEVDVEENGGNGGNGALKPKKPKH